MLENSEERFRSVVETANDAIICIDSHGNIDFWNQAATKIFGYSADEALGKPLTVLMPERFRGDYQSGMNRIVATGKSSIIGKTVAMVGLRKDGSEFPIELSVAAWKTKQGMFFTGIVRDVTKRKQAEEALQKARDELEQLVRERTAELTQANEQLQRNVEERKRIEEVLRKDQSSLAEAQRIAHLGNWDWNIVTNELRWSDEIYRIFGLTPQEFGATYESFLNSVHPDDRELVKKAVAEALYRGKPYSIEHRIILPDSTERIVHEQAGVTFDNAGKPIRMIGTVHDITERKRAEEALERSGEQLRRLSSQLLEVQENERKRIAGELHDSIGQSLTAIKFGLENAVSRLPQDEAKECVEALEALIPVVQQASEEVRQIHTDLRPSMLDDLGIVSTISWSCREFERLYPGTKIEKQIDIEEKEVPEPLEIVIFRVLQEALNNVAKYGKADLVRVLLKETDGQIELAVEDNGQGFDVEDVRSGTSLKKGFGLTSMRERTELSGGSFAIESAQGKGTVVRASWPHKVIKSIS